MSQQSLKTLDLLNAMAEYHSADMSETKLAMYASDLEDVTHEEIAAAWRLYRNKPQNVRMPTPAQLKDLVPDGRPSANEAWGMIPWDEDQSVVWNDEMIAGWSAARTLIRQGQKQSAFFAFKESYEKAVAEKKAQGLPPKWEASLGHDRWGREDCLRQAVSMGQLSLEKARGYLPELEAPTNLPSLAAPKSEVLKLVATLSKKISFDELEDN